jgi:hypothetical protein
MPGQSTPGTHAASTPGKVRILSHRVKGDTLTVVAEVPAAGRLRLLGKRLRSVSKQADAPERVTVRAVLTKAGAASLHDHAHRLRVRIELSFKPVSGASSEATASVIFG